MTIRKGDKLICKATNEVVKAAADEHGDRILVDCKGTTHLWDVDEVTRFDDEDHHQLDPNAATS